jgi:hypothetical protein
MQAKKHGLAAREWWKTIEPADVAAVKHNAHTASAGKGGRAGTVLEAVCRAFTTSSSHQSSLRVNEYIHTEGTAAVRFHLIVFYAGCGFKVCSVNCARQTWRVVRQQLKLGAVQLCLWPMCWSATHASLVA